MRKMRRYRDYLIEKLADAEIEETLSYLQVSLEEYQKDGYGDVLYLAYETAIKAQGGVQKFALKTHSTPQAVSDALLSKDEIQIAELLKKQVLAKRGSDKDIAKNETWPEGWREVKLGEISKFSKGSGITKSEVRDTGVPCIRYGELYTKHDLKVRNFYSFISNNDLDKRKLIKNNDLLFAGSGETKEEIGKCASFNHDIEAYAGGDVIICSLDPKEVRADFASCYLNTIGRRQMNRLGQGNSIVHIYSRYLEDVVIPLPSIEEQKAIASLLEKWDIAIEKTEALIETKEKRFKWLLKTLISDQQDNPEWREVKLGEICTFEYGKPLKEQDRIGNEYPVFGSNGIVGSHNEYLVAGPFIVVGRKGSAGTVSYSMSNGFPIDTTFYINLQSGEIHLRFLYYLLLLVELDKISAQSGVPGLNRNDAYKISISIPSSVEQREITRTLDVARREIDLLNQLAEQYRIQKRGLMQKLLTGKWRVKPNTKARM